MILFGRQLFGRQYLLLYSPNIEYHSSQRTLCASRQGRSQFAIHLDCIFVIIFFKYRIQLLSEDPLYLQAGMKSVYKIPLLLVDPKKKKTRLFGRQYLLLYSPNIEYHSSQRSLCASRQGRSQFSIHYDLVFYYPLNTF